MKRRASSRAVKLSTGTSNNGPIGSSRAISNYRSASRSRSTAHESRTRRPNRFFAHTGLDAFISIRIWEPTSCPGHGRPLWLTTRVRCPVVGRSRWSARPHTAPSTVEQCQCATDIYVPLLRGGVAGGSPVHSSHTTMSTLSRLEWLMKRCAEDHSCTGRAAARSDVRYSADAAF